MSERDDAIKRILLRMERAHKRGTGCHLSPADINWLNTTILGEQWAQARATDDDDRSAAAVEGLWKKEGFGEFMKRRMTGE